MKYALRISFTDAEMRALEKAVDALNESNFERGWPPDFTVENMAHAWIRGKLQDLGHLTPEEERDGSHIKAALEKLRGTR